MLILMKYNFLEEKNHIILLEFLSIGEEYYI